MKQIITILLVFCALHALSSPEATLTPPGELPVNVSINMYFNRILNINTIDESYEIDGYLELS
jgi:hypothetical protein